MSARDGHRSSDDEVPGDSATGEPTAGDPTPSDPAVGETDTRPESTAVPRDPPPAGYARFLEGSAGARRTVSRRLIVRGAVVAAGLSALAFAGQTIPFLRWVSFLAPRTGEGPLGVPINRTASAAGVVDAARATDYRLTVVGPARSVELTVDQLRRLPQHDSDLPIACVEGWSASGQWRGVRVKDLVAMVGGDAGHDVRFISLERGLYGVTVLPANFARNTASLVALELHGQTLTVDHGYPCRLITPNRPGVLQTKWLSRIEVL